MVIKSTNFIFTVNYTTVPQKFHSYKIRYLLVYLCWNYFKIIYLNITGGKSASSFMERCISFIEENAPECVKSNAFLNLPKEALIKLISSDNVSISPYLLLQPQRSFININYFQDKNICSQLLISCVYIKIIG